MRVCMVILSIFDKADQFLSTGDDEKPGNSCPYIPLALNDEDGKSRQIVITGIREMLT